MFSETIYFYFLAVMLLGSSAMVIFAPRMFLALIGLFFGFLFTGLVCLTLNAKFIALSLFVLGCLILCPIIFLLMKKINRWNLKLKVAPPLKIIVTCSVTLVFAFLVCLFVNEEFSNSLLSVFNLIGGKSIDIVDFGSYAFPVHIIIILSVITLVVVKAILRNSNSAEDDDV